MKFVALLSGGKDSIYATVRAIENGHELVCCAHLAPLRRGPDEEESHMYQTAGSEAVRTQVEGCMGVPLYVEEIRGRSRDISLAYGAGGGDDGDDEVEDLHLLLRRVLARHPDVRGVSSGAILSTYQRIRIEHVCARSGLTSLSYLWRASSQRLLVDSILDDGGIDAVLVRVACPPGLAPRRHLGRSLRELRDGGVLDRLRDRWGMHPAGEGGEYETLVLDCPKLFRRGRLVLDETEVVCDESDDGVGVLRIIKCSVERKQHEAEVVAKPNADNGIGTRPSQPAEQLQEAESVPAMGPEVVATRIHQSMHLPNVRMMRGGLCHISALLSPIACDRTDNNEAQAAVREFLTIRQMLKTILAGLFPGDQPPTSPWDILYVHLYLSQISHFADINQHYRRFFGMQLPPSRSCVAVGRGALPGGRRVMMDCVLQRGSGAYLRGDGHAEGCGAFMQQALQNRHHSLRKTLHVQSISTWAPVCIGPYSQANVLRSSLVLLAGTIGLVPQSMQLVEPTATSGLAGWEVQLRQSWRNAAAILDGLEDGGGRLEDCLGGLVYFSAGALESLAASDENVELSDFPWLQLWKTARRICYDAISSNAGIVMGSVDGATADDPTHDDYPDPDLYDEDGVLYGGYEDEETWRQMSGSTAKPSSPPAPDDPCVPLLFACLPELPAKAEAEVELILASRRAASCLEVGNGSLASRAVSCLNRDQPPVPSGILWGTGYDHGDRRVTAGKNKDTSSSIQISSVARYVGLGCACVSTVMATLKPGKEVPDEGSDEFNFDTEDILSRMIDSSINNAKGKDGMGSLFTVGDVLNVRLYYKAASVSRRKKNDGRSNSSSIKTEMKDDGSMLRTHLHSVLQLKSKQFHISNSAISEDEPVSIPAYTVVPVLGMYLSAEEESPEEETRMPLIAMQVTLADMIRMETEMWARHNRQYQYDN